MVGGRRTFSLGFQATAFDLSIKSPRPADVVGIAEQEAISGVTLGVQVRLPLRGALKDRIALGFGLYIPTKTLLSAEIPAPYTPQFSLIANRARSLSIQAGLAVEVAPWLRIGAGVRALAGLQGRIAVAPNELGRLGSEVEDELVARYAEIVGLQAIPHSRWSIGLVWRGALGGDYDLPVDSELGEDLPLQIPSIQIAGTAVADPGQLALHLGWKPLPGLRMETGVTWKHWKPYPLPIQNATAASPAQAPLLFQDTFVPRFGLETEHAANDSWSIQTRTGYAFEPTPVPEQTAEHTFLDGHRHIISLGLGIDYRAPEESHFGLTMNFYGQLHLMQPRTFVKALPTGAVPVSENAAFPWISAGATIWSGGCVLEVQL
jgi:hypothetical protein